MGQSQSHVTFKECVTGLQQQKIGPRAKLWDAILNLESTAEELFALLQPVDVRTMKKEQPMNLLRLMLKCVVVLDKSLVSKEALDTKRIINAIRILARLVPFVIEDQSDNFYEKVLWLNTVPDPAPVSNNEEGGGGGGGEGDGGLPPRTPELIAREKEFDKLDAEEAEIMGASDPLARQIISLVYRFCFLPGFTVSSTLPTPDPKGEHLAAEEALLWASGTGCKDTTSAAAAWRECTVVMANNRMDCIRLLLACFSQSLYENQEESNTSNNKWLGVGVSPRMPHMTTLFHSLLNIVCSYDPIGWAIPYTHNIMGLSSEWPEVLLDNCFQLLLVYLDYLPKQPPASESEEGGEGGGAMEVEGCVNHVVTCLASLSSSKDFTFMFNGLQRLLNSIPYSANTYLPNAIKAPSCNQEMLMLLWRLVEHSPEFLSHSFKSENITLIITPILYFMFTGKKYASQGGIIQICAFILLKLSSHRNFGVAMNGPFTPTISLDLPLFTGNYGDFLFLVLYKLIVDGHPGLKPLHKCFIEITTNISPYVKSFCMMTCSKLLSLFKRYSSPRVFFASEDHASITLLLLELFSNIIQYQYEGNSNMIYCIVRGAGEFEKFLTIEIPSPVSDAAPAREGEGGEGAAVKEEEGEKEVLRESDTKEKEKVQGPPAWSPPPEYLVSIKSRHELSTVLQLVRFLNPQVEGFCLRENSADEAKICNFIKNTTLVGLLPVPHPLLSRRIQPNHYMNVVFSTFVWGTIFLRNQKTPLFDSGTVKLFALTMG